MGTCFRGSESSVFLIRTHEFHRKTLFVNKSGKWAKCPQMPSCGMQERERGWGLPGWS